MTKHKLVAKQKADDFDKLVESLESQGWQGIPSTFSAIGQYWTILVFKVESDSPYRTEATP